MSVGIVAEDTLLRAPQLYTPKKQPITPVKLDMRYLLARDCIGFWPLWQLRGGFVPDLTRTYPAEANSESCEAAFSTEGRGVMITADNTAARLDLANRRLITSEDRLSGYSSQEISVFAFGRFHDSNWHTNYPHIIAKSSGGAGSGGWAFFLVKTGTSPAQSMYFSVNGLNRAAGANTLDATDGLPHTMGVCAKSGEIDFYYDGEFVATNTNAITFPATSCYASLLNWAWSTDRQWYQVPMYVIAAWDRKLTKEEMLWLHSDPYGLVIPA